MMMNDNIEQQQVQRTLDNVINYLLVIRGLGKNNPIHMVSKEMYVCAS